MKKVKVIVEEAPQGGVGPSSVKSSVLFDTVDKIVMEKGKLKIDYRVTGKDKVQYLELPVDKIYRTVLEFF